jgi:hypothetical protein
MKGLETTLWIVIAAILALIIALVLLTMFGTSVASFSTLTDANNFCNNQCQISCKTLQQIPLGWATNKIKVAGDVKTCQDIVGSCNC